MRKPGSDGHDRTPHDDDFATVSAEDCIKAYLEFPSEADLASLVTDNERRKTRSEFASEDDLTGVADDVAAFIAEADDPAALSDVDTSEQMESTIAVLSESVPPAQRPAVAWSVDPPKRRFGGIVVAIGAIAALATGVLAGRVILGSHNVAPEMRVAVDPSPTPMPQTAAVQTQAKPAAASIPAPDTRTQDRQRNAPAPQRAVSTVALADSASNGPSNSPRSVVQSALNSPRAVQSPLLTPATTPSAVEPAPPVVALSQPPPAAVAATSGADVGGGDPPPVARINPPAPVTPQPTPASLPVAPVPVGTSGAAVVSAATHVDRVLARYQAAFSGLDVEAVRQVWPTADGKALSKAFEQLEEERLTFESCDVKMTGVTAAAICKGTMRFVPRVGSKTARVQRHQWHLSLREAANGWVIDSVDTRPNR